MGLRQTLSGANETAIWALRIIKRWLGNRGFTQGEAVAVTDIAIKECAAAREMEKESRKEREMAVGYKHTPGQWRIMRSPTIVRVYAGDGSCVTRVPNRLDSKGELDSEEWLANARLIAGAPELLAACECGAPKSGPALLRMVAELLESYRSSPAPIKPTPVVIKALRRKADAEEEAINRVRGEEESDA